ncbi:amino acid deaminase/aldolase [Pseudonocardiaceae bacterium YIM PH 21723]|nr:amino acid deaminase/aldolase [Pseudonocardiaceae bacterium YIM PH 21723]
MSAEALRRRLDQATAQLEPPLAAVDLDAFDRNAADLVRRAGGKPIRVASKSIRCRTLLDRALARPGFAGVLSYSLAEALWLAETCQDVLVGYPTTDRAALRRLIGSDRAREAVTIMVDDVAQLDLIDATFGSRRAPIQVCLDLDASWHGPAGVSVGPLRSPAHTVPDAVRLARAVLARPGFSLVGVMSYEGQIAGVQDHPRGQFLRGALVRVIKSRSVTELAERRALAVAAIGELTELRFVNGGGTGSLETTAAEDAITELAAGSGLIGPTLFDGYRTFRPAPALFFALPVVRKPGPRVATVFGGGYLASGPADSLRLPVPYLPSGLRLSALEGAGEVQTPLLGRAADSLAIGDRVWFRPAKAGELAERFPVYHLVQGAESAETPTYRGESQTFG